MLFAEAEADIMLKLNAIIVLLYIQNSHTKTQVDISPLQCRLRQHRQIYWKPCYFGSHNFCALLGSDVIIVQ